MKYIFIFIAFLPTTFFAMEQEIDDQISSLETRKVKNCWWATGTEIIINDEYCKRKEEFSKIVADCSCDVLYDLLYCAAKLPHGAPYVRELFTRKDCCACGREIDDKTPLHLAIASNGSLETIQLLMKQGGLIDNNNRVHNHSTNSFKTPCAAAAFYGRSDVLQEFLKDKKTIDVHTIRLIQKKYDALTKLAQLAGNSSSETEDSLKLIRAVQSEWGAIRKAVAQCICEEAKGLS